MKRLINDIYIYICIFGRGYYGLIVSPIESGVRDI